MNAFVETRFDPGIIPRGVGGPVWKTSIIRTGADTEKRNIVRAEWLFEGNFGEILLHEEQVAYTIAFFNARRGKYEGFRYKYWGDYECTHEPLALNPSITTPNTTTTQGVVTLMPSGVYQLQKKYVDAGDVTYKTITKPVEGTVVIYPGGTVDYTTGIVSGGTTWSGEFDLPVWFDVDSLLGVHVYNDDRNVPFYPKKELLYRFESLPIVELPI